MVVTFPLALGRESLTVQYFVSGKLKTDASSFAITLKYPLTGPSTTPGWAPALLSLWVSGMLELKLKVKALKSLRIKTLIGWFEYIAFRLLTECLENGWIALHFGSNCRFLKVQIWKLNAGKTVWMYAFGNGIIALWLGFIVAKFQSRATHFKFAYFERNS